MTNKILLTGASGFIGSAIYQQLIKNNNNELVVPYRSGGAVLPSPHIAIHIDGINSATDWRQALIGVQVIVHSAARAHIMNDIAVDPLTEFRKINTQGTLNLARQAAVSGVKRFIFISSIKVNGECTKAGFPYTADDIPAPVDAYGISKMEAEQGLQALAAETTMEIVIIRPVLVYGIGVKANFLNIMSWMNKSFPLPLGYIHNKRSLVALENLVDLIVTCISHPNAANQIFLVSDDEDLSTTELLLRMAKALNKPSRLLPVPALLLKLAASIIGKRSVVQRLCGSLQVDINKTKAVLGWTPPIRVDDALQKTARYVQTDRVK